MVHATLLFFLPFVQPANSEPLCAMRASNNQKMVAAAINLEIYLLPFEPACNCSFSLSFPGSIILKYSFFVPSLAAFFGKRLFLRAFNFLRPKKSLESADRKFSARFLSSLPTFVPFRMEYYKRTMLRKADSQVCIYQGIPTFVQAFESRKVKINTNVFISVIWVALILCP